MNDSFIELKKFLEVHSVTLVAISKTKTPEEIMRVYSEGQQVFGENKVQELLDKYDVLPKNIQWHLVGHLQTNKVKYVAPFVSLIHSVDSFGLLETINKQEKKNNRIIEVLLQVYIASEETKFGLSFEETREVLLHKKLVTLENICIRGFMGMATFTDDVEQVRKEFRSLKIFFEEMKVLQSSNFKPEILSMGMSGDYKMAVEEGSTMVRIGSAIFGARN